MSNFIPGKEHMRTVLLFAFHWKKNAAEGHKMLVEAYGEHALSETRCREWFRRFKEGDFHVVDRERPGQSKKFEDVELQALLDEDPRQTQKQLAEALDVAQQTISHRLKALGYIQKEGKWVPHDLTERQMENRRATSELHLRRYKRKSFLHCIVTGDEKWIYFENPKRKKSYVKPGTPVKSTPKQNRFGKKTMLCVWWDQKGIIYYELLKPGETVNAHRYQQQLIELSRKLKSTRPEYETRQHKVIFLHDNAPAHKAHVVQNTLEALRWEVMDHAAYSPDLAPSDYHLFLSMSSGLADQHFKSFEEVEKWVADWFASKPANFYWRGIHKLPERWKKCVASDGKYFE